MSYRIVHPVAMPIDANDFRDAVKKFIKLNHFMNIEQIILSDQYNHMRANVKYYDDNKRRKASIQLIPIDAAAVPSYIGFSSTDPKAPYPNPGLSFAVGPSMIGGPAGIIAPAGPVMVERPAMIGGPVIGGPAMIGVGMPGPFLVNPPGGPNVAGVVYGARNVPASSGSATVIGPSAVITGSNQILPIAPVNPPEMVGTDGKPVTGAPVPFGRGVIAGIEPAVVPGRVIGMNAARHVVVGGPMGHRVNFGRGVF